MKAMVFEKYGQPDVLQLKEVEKPTPKDDEVMVKVLAASVNDWDWGVLRGKPLVNRLIFGLTRPKKSNILGCDIAGKVESVEKNVTKFKPGDEVFGDLSEGSWGGYAEYVCASENELVPKPAKMTFEEAAAVPQVGSMVVKGLLDMGNVKPGQRVLFNGAGGGVGTLGVQIAKSLGAHVTGVDKASKLDILLKLGADEVIDYKKEDFTKNRKQYDLILDVMVNRSMFAYKRALSPNGIYLMMGGSIPRIFLIAIVSPLIIRGKKLKILALNPNKGLDVFSELFEAGKVKPVIDRTYPLSELPEALEYFGESHHKGKIIIKIV
ncbi:MAG: NAD(P)-dependent alcohol dehydrogenase [Thermoplasmata archaeon]|nr:MAG: NAD(P)-dependent alcohol dehydrogenase [Thermoplasmata archaeon]